MSWLLRNLNEVLLGNAPHSVQVSKVELVTIAFARQIRVVECPNYFDEVGEDSLADILTTCEKPTQLGDEHISIKV